MEREALIRVIPDLVLLPALGEPGEVLRLPALLFQGGLRGARVGRALVLLLDLARPGEGGDAGIEELRDHRLAIRRNFILALLVLLLGGRIDAKLEYRTG